MIKKSISWMVFLLLMTAACAQAAPQLTNVTADGESLHAGKGWTVSFETTEGGALAMQLRGTKGETVDLGATQVDAGSGQLVWDGVLPTEARRRTAFTRSRFSCATTGAKRAKKACCR